MAARSVIRCFGWLHGAALAVGVTPAHAAAQQFIQADAASRVGLIQALGLECDHGDGDMKSISTVAIGAILLWTTGCATVKYWAKDAEATLRGLQPIPGKVSLYVCREGAAFVGAGNRTTVVVDNRSIGTLKPNNFAHAVLEPGSHDIYVEHNPGGKSGVLKIEAGADEVPIVWVGMTGHGWGALTVDHFRSRSEAEECVRRAQYAVPTE